MSRRVAPPGKSFKERWPRDAAEAQFFSKSSYAVALGGVLGVLMVPLLIRDRLTVAPLALAIVVGVVVLLTLAVPRVTGSGRDWLAKAWKVGAWVLAAGALGLVIDSIMLAMCDAACTTALLEERRRTSPSVLLYALLVAGSIGIAWLVDRAGDALRRRAPTLP